MINKNSLEQVSGGKVIIKRKENGDIDYAQYYCDKCSALVYEQIGSEISTKKPFSLRWHNEGSTILCKECKNKQKANISNNVTQCFQSYKVKINKKLARKCRAYILHQKWSFYLKSSNA